jgi:hypothetical protein
MSELELSLFYIQYIRACTIFKKLCSYLVILIILILIYEPNLYFMQS